MGDRRYFAREPSVGSIVDEWAVLASDDANHPITVEVGGTALDLSIREARAMRTGLSRAIKASPSGEGEA